MKPLPIITTIVLMAVGRAFADDSAAFPADITHGDIRCVLMSVGQTTVFPNEKDSARDKRQGIDGRQGVPCFTVTLLVEGLNGAPNEPVCLRNLDVFLASKEVHMEDKPSEQEWFDYNVFQSFLDFNKPSVANRKRAHILRYVKFGSVSNQQPLSLVIEIGFDKDIQTFEFDSIHFR